MKPIAPRGVKDPERFAQVQSPEQPVSPPFGTAGLADPLDQFGSIHERARHNRVAGRACEVADCHANAESTRFADGWTVEMCPRCTGRVQRLVRDTDHQPSEAAQLVREGAGEVEVGP
jgi:hypothetical protein